ncbi:hypothetical protein ACFSJ3_03145 [Corallincola platygyrae]|uniref:Uncharacterized protein n=1 Tax=Corallincola platygyrae TaxID=1193278 RepID=A0ABW4XJM1_9GAMM
MDSQLTTLAVYALLCLAPADAIRNDTELKDELRRRTIKGVGWGVFLSTIPCLLLFLVQNDLARKGEAVYSTLQWAVALPLSGIIFTTIFTALFVLRPHPSRNSIEILKFFTILFWAASVALIFFCSIYLVNQVALLLA